MKLHFCQVISDKLLLWPRSLNDFITITEQRMKLDSVEIHLMSARFMEFVGLFPILTENNIVTIEFSN